MYDMRKSALLLVVTIVSIGAAPQDPLTRARQLYNQQMYEAAIEAATAAQRSPRTVEAATLVLARAHLERFRQSSDAADLAAAHSELQQIHAAALAPLDRIDLVIGLGEALYFDDRAGAAAEEFELALNRPVEKDEKDAPDEKRVRTRERVLDWWASALDRQAQLGSESERRPLYARIVIRMEDELRHDAGSAVASYWLVAGARGSGDLERAWDAALAGWVRASLAGDRSAALRADLERIVSQALIPERARLMSPAGGSGAGGAGNNLAQAVAAMRGQWDALKQTWAAP